MEYRIMRDCCTSGQCFACKHLPYGTKIRMEHTRSTDLTKANSIAYNWRAYNTTVVDEKGIQIGIPEATPELSKMVAQAVEGLRENAQAYHEHAISHEEFTKRQKGMWEDINMQGVEFVDYVLDVLRVPA